MSYEKRWKGKKTDDPKVIRGKRKRQESDVKDYDKEEIYSGDEVYLDNNS